MEKTNPSELPQMAVDYIHAVVKAMKYHRSVRAEVRQELTDHFTDAVADCRTAEEKQKAAAELIAEFGDVKLLGKLLRRAKKRCRPLWRTMVVRTFQFIGICFGLLILYIGWFFTGKPIITTNYLEVLNQKARPVADESQNAWPFYKQAVEVYVEPPVMESEPQPSDTEFGMGPMSESNKFDETPRRLETLSQQERGILDQWLTNNDKVIGLIHQGNQKPYYWQIYDTGEKSTQELLAILLPHLSNYRNLAYLMCWQGLVSAEQGDYKKTFDDIFEAYSFGLHLLGQNNTLIEQLLAIGIKTMSTYTLCLVLSEYGGEIDAALFDSIYKRFESLIAAQDFIIDFSGEKLFLYDEIQRSFTQSRIGKSHLYLQRIHQLGPMLAGLDEQELVRSWFHILFTHPDRDETLRTVNEFFEVIEENASKTPATRQKGENFIEDYFEEYVKRNLFLELLIPAMDKVIQLSYRSRIDSEAALTILAILEYQKQSGKLPETLNELVEKRALNEVPVDPFSDKPLVYKKTNSGFMLYSVGLNFTDDSGVPDTDSEGKSRNWGENGDHIFWPVDSVNSQQ